MGVLISQCPSGWLIGRVCEKTYAVMPDAFMPGGMFFNLRGRFREALMVWEGGGLTLDGGTMPSASQATRSLVYGLLFI
jgi:hypothetical protein